LPGLDLASLATQGVGAEAQPNAYTGYGISKTGVSKFAMQAARCCSFLQMLLRFFDQFFCPAMILV